MSVTTTAQNAQAIVESVAEQVLIVKQFLKAAVDGDDVTAKKCLASGCPVDVTDSNGFSALVLAARKNHFDFVKMLLDNGASVNLRTAKQNTALMYSCANGKTDIFNLLLEKVSVSCHLFLFFLTVFCRKRM